MLGARRFRIWRRRLRSLFASEQADESLARELAFHIEQLTAEYMAQGLSRRLAREAARREFGNATLYAEEARDHRRVAWLLDFKQDVGYGLRQLRAHPGFTVVAVASLALGIGANTAMLGTLEAGLNGALPLPDAERLVLLRGHSPQRPNQWANATVPEYFAWAERARSFSSMGLSIANRQDLTGDGFLPQRLEGQAVTPSLFRTLGVAPMLGRTFAEDEGAVEKPAHVIVLSHALWQRLFGGDRDVLNRTLTLNGEPYTVVGIMPPGFFYPVDASEYWIPIAITPAQRRQSARLFGVVARLRPGVARRQAQADLDVVAAGLAREFPDRQFGWSVRTQSLRDTWFGWLRRPLGTLAGASALVLLLACVNVATLLLARATVRRPEFAMRLALGASPLRLLRQLMTESVLLASLGGACGLALAWFGASFLTVLQPPPAGAQIGNLSLGFEALAITVGLSLLCGLLFGAAPTLIRWKTGARLRSVLVAAQVGLALILVIGSGLLIKSLVLEANADRGFEVDGLLTFDLRIPPRDIEPFRDRLLALPEVESAAAVSAPPVLALAPPTVVVSVEGRPAPVAPADRDAATAVHLTVTPGYLEALHARLTHGRHLDETDTEDAPWSAVINETMARRFWPGENAVGRRILFGSRPGERPRVIAGIVRDMTIMLGGMVGRPVVYTSYRQQPPSAVFGITSFVLRGPRDSMALAPAIRHAAAEFDPARPVANLTPLVWWGGTNMINRGFYTGVLFAFATMATLLACIGVYGVTAYTVSQRTREIGIRLALGGQLAEIRRWLCGRSAALIVAGVALGSAGALALTRNLAFQLQQVSPYDPWIFGGAIVLLGLVALAASFAPTRRARAIDPASVLRQE